MSKKPARVTRKKTRAVRAAAGSSRAGWKHPRPHTESRSGVTSKGTAANSPDPLPSAIVAVGASAGGLEAFSQVLEHLDRNPDIAFIFVQHLSPQHSSALPELLGPKTNLSVVQATNGIAIAPNHVYVIPPNVHMDVVEGKLHLMPRPTDRSQFTPIDFFFQSVARWARDRAIGVILSGTASDGSAGIREIKTLGGITIAQKPETARHDGMPRAAIATGMVDLVLSPQEIAENLSSVRWHPYLLTQTAADATGTTFTDAQFREIFTILRRSSGIDFKQYKMPTIRRRVLRRMALLRLTDPLAYVTYLGEHAPEARALSQDLLIH